MKRSEIVDSIMATIGATRQSSDRGKEEFTKDELTKLHVWVTMQQQKKRA